MPAMTICALCLAVIFVSASNAQSVGSKLWQESRVGAVSLVTLVSDAEFSEDQLAQTCTSYAAEQKLNFFQWIAITSGQESMYLRQPYDNFTFDGWKQMYDRANSMPWKVALCVYNERGSVLVIHNGEKITERVLSGADPLKYVVWTGTFKILGFSLQAANVVTVYAQSGGIPNEDSAKELFRVLKAAFPVNHLDVNVRKDPWFLFHPGYFIYNPFTLEHRPEYEVWRQSPESRCSDLTGHLQCIGYPGGSR